LAVWARREAALELLLSAGARRYASPAEVASHSDVVFTMVTTGADVEEVVLGHAGIIHGARPGTVVVDCSTIAPETVRRIGAELRVAGVELVDAPVSGGEAGAIAGTLSIMAGGKPEVIARVRPLLECVGRTIVHVGDSGAGQVAKAANQLVLIMTIQGIAEAMTLAQASGVAFHPVWESMTQGPAASRMLDLVGPRMMQREFDAGIDARLHHKDADIVLQCAFASRTPVPGAALAAQAFNALMARPDRRWDSAAILQVLEDLRRADG
jgi:2-hydroxy-3-oxopropionate reductase